MWATLLVSALAGLGCAAHTAHAAQMSRIKGELYVDLGKETQKHFSSQKYILHVSGKYQLKPCEKLNLIEEKHSTISAYPGWSPCLTRWVRSPVCINQRKSIKLYWFTQAYFLIQWYFRLYNYDLKYSTIYNRFLKEKGGKAIQWIRVKWNMGNHITTVAKSNTSLLHLRLRLLSLLFFLFLW